MFAGACKRHTHSGRLTRRTGRIDRCRKLDAEGTAMYESSGMHGRGDETARSSAGSAYQNEAQTASAARTEQPARPRPSEHDGWDAGAGAVCEYHTSVRRPTGKVEDL